jgi:ABC-2 type transport system ATP-binding protein
MAAISVENLTKVFNGLRAVDRISFEVKEGELFGLLGPNGAGKTTTLNMLATLIRPTSGKAFVSGFDVLKERDKVRKSIGMVFQEPALDNYLTGRENLEFHGMMYGLSRKEAKERVKEALKIVELEEFADKLVQTYSGGMKRRLEIGRALVHQPKVLFLDEPTLGLDAQTRRRIWEYIKKLNEEKGVTIILTTHYMEEADFLAKRVAIIDFGKIVALDTPENLKNLLGGDVISVEVDNPRSAKKVFEELPWVKKLNHENGIFYLQVEKGEEKIPLLIKIDEKEVGFKIKSINLRKPTLEDVFLHFTGRTIREREASQAERFSERAKRHRR